MNAKTSGKTNRKYKPRQKKSAKAKTSKAHRAADLEQLIIASVQGLPLTENLARDPDGVFADPQALRNISVADRSKQKRG